MKGCLITFEGGEAVGKTTQILLLVEHLAALGCDVLSTREPGGTFVGEGIRGLLLDPSNRGMDPVCEALLYAASRAEHLRRVILPALSSGRVVLCDRYLDSSLAYQGYGRGLDLGWIRAINRPAAAVTPARTFLLTMDSAEALARKPSGRDRLEREAEAFHARVRGGFLDLARDEPDRFRVLDASRPVPDIARSIAEDAERVVAASYEEAHP